MCVNETRKLPFLEPNTRQPQNRGRTPEITTKASLRSSIHKLFHHRIRKIKLTTTRTATLQCMKPHAECVQARMQRRSSQIELLEMRKASVQTAKHGAEARRGMRTKKKKKTHHHRSGKRVSTEDPNPPHG
uniref:Uncharacterized protein n=1 Tax=Physcomitrium patens TaxID=3218 RepID=A0A2K1KMB0_PHYPA|nr:hypothetical protein PHYPA_005811 [Physcomitrium patens]